MSAGSNAPHILVADDEPDIRDTVEEYLSMNGFRVITADSAAAVRDILAEQPVDLVILDVRMPGEDGLSLARHLREHYTIGIVMLTAVGAMVDRVVGLEMGADDYIAKPVDLRELLARVKAVLRRLRPATAPAEAGGPVANEVAFGDCRLNLDSHKLFDRDGQEITLTSMEFDLLKAFAENPNRVLSRDRLLDLAHSRDWEPFDRSIDVRIARLRKKVEVDPAKPQIIKTIRGAGYLFSPSRRD